MSNDYEKKRSALTVSTASIDAYSDELKRIENKNDVQPMKGWMKKKSPALLKGWQKRYFMLIENMQEGPWKLVYFDNDKTDTKPNGAFDLHLNSNPYRYSTPTILLYQPLPPLIRSRKKNSLFNFLAEIQNQKLKLLNCVNNGLPLLMVSEQHLPLREQRDKSAWIQQQRWQTRVPPRHKTIRLWIRTQPNRHKCIRRSNAILYSQTYPREIQIERDPLNYKKIKEKQNTQQLSNEKMLELIGLKEFIKNMNEQFIYQRMIYGYLGKRSKGKVKYFQKRWFILVSLNIQSLNHKNKQITISAKPLYSDYNDEKILQESQLPPWLELDTITYFKQKEEGKPPKAKGDVKMLDCQEIIIKNMSKSKESGYTFKLNMGDRLYHLMADSELERTKWQTALSASIRITKEINNPLKIKIKKNIDPLIQLYDEETQLIARREKIRQKLEQDIAVILKEEAVDLNKLISQLTDLRQDMLESMQASIVKDPQRKDIVKEYTDIYHERICERITKFWDQNYMKLQSPELLLLGQWLHDYLLQMKDFFNDDRILLGVGVLLNIYVNRSLESMESVIYQIIEQERIQEPFLNDQEQLVTQTPVDLFKIINEGFDMAYKLCSCKETVLRFGGFGKVILQQYQGGIQEIIDEYQLSVAKFVAICNNTMALYDNTKQYSKRLQTFGNLSDEEVEKVFDGQKITKNFVQIANNCRERIFIFYFSRVGTHFKKPYLEIKIIDTLKSIIEPATEALSQLHDSFNRKLWKQLTDSIILYYFNQFIISCSKAKKEQQNEFIRKLENDKEILFQELETFIFEKQLQATLKPFDDMIQMNLFNLVIIQISLSITIVSFLNEESLSILDPCKSLRQYFGRAFSEKTIKSIMTLRFDLDKEQKKDTIEICKNLIDDINKTQPIEEDTVRIMDFLGQEDEEQNNTQTQQQEQVQRRADIRLDFNDSEIQQIPQQQQKRASIEKEEFIDEGYLYKKKPKSKAWDYRFVRIRKGFMYWYINSNSREAQNKINLQSVDEVIPNPKKSTNFKIQLEDSKIYKFKTQTKEECELWIKTILREQNQTEVAIITLEAIQIGNGKLPIIKDYDEIARKERQRQKQEERKRKRIEKENEFKKKQMELKLLQQQQLKELGDKPQPHQVDVFEQQMGTGDSTKKTTSCWTSFLI